MMSAKRSYEEAFVPSGEFNVNNYKYDYELEHQWEVKRKFMLAHQEKYPEDRLICLAQIFCNVHFMGCRYDDNVMELIEELSKGIIDKNKKWEKVSFVAASNAVEERVRGRLNAPQRNQPQQQQQQQQHHQPYNSGPNRRPDFSSSSQGGNYSGRDNWVGAQGNFQKSGNLGRPNFVNFSQNRNDGPNERDAEQQAPTSSSSKFINFVKSASRQAACSSDESSSVQEATSGERRRGFTFVSQGSAEAASAQTRRPIEPLMKTPIPPPPSRERIGKGKKGRVEQPQGIQLRNKLLQSVVESGPFGRLVLIENLQRSESPGEILGRAGCNPTFSIEYSYFQELGNITCKVFLKKLFLSSGVGKTRKIAKQEACKIAIERLKETSFTIQVKKAYVSNETVDRSLQKTDNSDVSASVDVPIDESNIGKKLLTLMGWSGGGLGKDEQGIEEPISASTQTVNRSGLGVQNFNDLRKKVMSLLENYAKNDSRDDLVFSPEFSKEERKIIHEMSTKYHLKSKSYGNDNNRHLVISKRASYLEIVDELLDCGGETEKYKLIPPKHFQNGMNAFE